MKPSILLISLLAVGAHGFAWFGSDTPQYHQWSNDELKQWLNEHHVLAPTIDSYTRDDLVAQVKYNWNTASAWTHDQYASAQQSFANLRESTIDTWDESQLRQFLMDQGIVAPNGYREELLQMARARYQWYTNAASLFASQASATASTAVYGDAQFQATQSISSIVAQATNWASRSMDDSKDYVYSAWDDNLLRSYLIEKGVLKSKTRKTREEMLVMMEGTYAKTAEPVWSAWSDSYMREWLATHNLIDDRSNLQKNRDALLDQMSQYYYESNSYVWDTWADSDLKAWLVEHHVVKSEAEVTRDKMIKMVSDSYSNAYDTFWDAWSDSQLRFWLINNGYIRSDAHVKRDELIKTINEKYTDISSRTAAYLAWPDARLRAFLREHGLNDKEIPVSRPGLLQETRIRYTQTTTKTEALFNSIRDIVNSGVYAAEDKLHNVWNMLSGGTEQMWNEGKAKAEEGAAWTQGQKKVDATPAKMKNEL